MILPIFACVMAHAPGMQLGNSNTSHPVGFLDTALGTISQTVLVYESDNLAVAGWAADYNDNGPARVVQVLVDGTSMGNATLGISRPDVASAYNNLAWKPSGWTFAISAASLPVGTHTVSAIAVDSVGLTTTLGSKSITVRSSTPIGFLDTAVGSTSQTSTVYQSDSLSVAGWAADYNDNGPARAVQVLVDGTSVGSATLGTSRSDVASAYNNPAWKSSGWTFRLNASSLSVGNHTVFAVASDSLGLTSTFGPNSIVVRSSTPIGFLDTAVGSASQTSSLYPSDSLVVAGWAADYNDNGPARAVQVLLDGAPVGNATLGLSRPDVASAYNTPTWKPSGWTFRLSAASLSVDTHTISAVASDSLGLTSTLGSSAFKLVSTTTAQVIKHIVVIFDENVSFDHYFGTYPLATNPAGEPAFTALSGTPTPANLSGTLLTNNPNSQNTTNGSAAVNPFRLDRAQAATADQDHGYYAEQIAFHNGAMDLFPYSVGTPDAASLVNQTGAPAIAATNGLTMGYFDGNTVTALWNYAQHYALNDHFFATNFGPSTPGAINLISGQTNGVIADAGASGSVVSDGNAGYTLIGDPDPTGDLCGNAGNSVHMTGKNIGDLLTAAGVSWGWFAGGFDLTATNTNGSTGCGRSSRSVVTTITTNDYNTHHEPFQYYASTANLNHVRPSSLSVIGTNADAANHQYDLHDFTDAINAGNMPAVSFLKPPNYQEGHAGYSDPLDEQTFLVNTINAIQQSAFWQSTAIVIAYDDSDGWYDHLMDIVNASQSSADGLVSAGNCSSAGAAAGAILPGVNSSTTHAQGRCGYGPRLPLLVVSPWAKPNNVDSTVLDQTSIPRFIEDTFLSGQRLGGGSFDSLAKPMDSFFDLTHATPQNPAVILLDPSTGLVTSSH